MKWIIRFWGLVAGAVLATTFKALFLNYLAPNFFADRSPDFVASFTSWGMALFAFVGFIGVEAYRVLKTDY